MKAKTPKRSDVWDVNLDPTLGHEQKGVRPCLIVSVDPFNESAAELVIVLPMTSKEKRIPTHVPVGPSEGGLRMRSYIKCEDVRSISTKRLIRRRGSVNRSVMSEVEKRLKLLLDL